MKIMLFGRLLSFEKPAQLPTILDKETTFIQRAEELTELWAELRAVKSQLAPWIDWKTKEVFITEIVTDRERVRK